MPMIVGLEANATRLQSRNIHTSDADSGRPETSAEFAKRMARNVRVRGPRLAQEGGNTTPAKTAMDLDVAKPSGDKDKQSNLQGQRKLIIRIP
ncbi:hypothetical protein V5O48_019631, partial [Marasmius crinis-equi]